MSEIKDSGERTEFSTGAVRDMSENKGRCDLLPMCALLRLAVHYENGCKKYGDRNWEVGIPAHSFADSALRHLMKYMDGMDDEDHLIAAAWNILGLAWTEAKHPELIDIPARKGKKTFSYGESAELPAGIGTVRPVGEDNPTLTPGAVWTTTNAWDKVRADMAEKEFLRLKESFEAGTLFDKAEAKDE